MTTQHTMLRELALLAVLATLWGASYTFIKIGVETIPPITLIAARTLIAGLVLLAVLYLRGVRLPTDKAVWRRFVIQSCLNSAVPFTLIAWAEQSIDAGLAVILNSTTPIFTLLLTAFVTRHESVTGRKLFGIVVWHGRNLPDHWRSGVVWYWPCLMGTAGGDCRDDLLCGSSNIRQGFQGI